MDDLERARRCGEQMWINDKASQALGIEVDIPEAGAAVATMLIREDMVNGFGVCHGGLLVALADTAFAFACNAYNDVTLASAVQAEFLRPAQRGDVLSAIAREEYRGRKTGYYTIRIVNQDKELVSLFRGRSAATGEALLPAQK